MLAIMQHRPTAPRRFKAEAGHTPTGVLCCAIPLHWTERSRDAALDTLSLIERYDSPAPRNQIHQALESSFHCFEIFVYIGMVEFDRGKDHRVREIVQKLWAFVEECSVVLVGLNDEMSSST